METVLTLLSIPLLLFFPGWALLPGRTAAATLRTTIAETMLVRVLVSFLVTSFCGVLLAQLGLFSLLSVSLVALLCGLAARFAVRRDPQPDAGKPHRRFRFADLWLLVLLAICIFASTSAFEVVTGGGDAGVYANSGVLISETGGFDLSDELFDGLTKRERQLFTWDFEGREAYRGARGNERRLLDMIHRGRAERFRGMFLDPSKEDRASRPQFLPLLPVWMAILHGWGGIQWLVRVNILLGLLSLCSLYFVGTRVFGGKPGAGAALSGLVAINVAQFWFIRYPSAEMLVQMLFFCGAHLVLVGDTASRPRRRLLICGGCLLGAATMAKFFGIFLLLPVGLAWFFSRARSGAGERRRWNLVLAGLIPSALFGVAGGMFFSAAYLRSHLLNQQYFKFYIPAVVLLVLALLLRRWVGTRIAAIGAGAGDRPFRIGAVALLFVTALYAYFIRPRSIEIAGSNNFAELGWYLTPLGLLLGLVGFSALLLGRSGADGLKRAPFLPWAAILVSVVVLGGTADMPLHIFSIRRMVPVTIPVFLLFGLVPLRWLWGRARPLGPLAALALALAVVLLPLRDGAWKTFTHREQDGAVAQLQDLAAGFAPEDVLIFDDLDDLALPMRVLCGHRNTLAYFGRGIHAHSLLTRYLQRAPDSGEGRNLFLTTQPTLFGQPPERTFVLSWPLLELSGTRIPSEETRGRHLVNLYSFPDAKAWRYQTSRIDVGGADFPYVDGFYTAATHHRRFRQNFRRVGANSVIALPAGTVKVGLRMARVEDEAATVTVRFGGGEIDRFIPHREFDVRSVKVSRDDGLLAPGALVISVDPAAAGENQPFSSAGLAEVVMMGRYGLMRLKPGGDEDGLADGWGPVETEAGTEQITVRWTGASARIRAPGTATLLRLNLSNGSRPRSMPPARVILELNGRQVGPPIEPGARFRTVDIPVPPSEYGRESQILTIRCNTWNPYYAGRGGTQDRALGVVVEGLEILRPNSSLERGLAKVSGGRYQDGQVLIAAYAEQFGRRSDWRIPLGLALAQEKMGRASMARAGYKESLSIDAENNESYRFLRQLSGRHDARLRDREHPGWRERARGEDGPTLPPTVSDPWMSWLVNRGDDSPLILEPGEPLDLEYAGFDHDGLAMIHLVAQPLPGEAEDGSEARSQLSVMLDGVSIGTLDLSREHWQSLVACGAPAPGGEHRLTVRWEGPEPLQIKRVLVY